MWNHVRCLDLKGDDSCLSEMKHEKKLDGRSFEQMVRFDSVGHQWRHKGLRMLVAEEGVRDRKTFWLLACNVCNVDGEG